MTKPLRVTHVITGLDIGGAEVMLYRLLSAMPSEEFPAQVISLTSDGPMGTRIRSLGVQVTALGMQSIAGGPAAILRLAHWLRRNPADVIQTWMYHADLVGGLAAALEGHTPLVWGIHNSVLDAHTSKRTTRWTVKLLSRLSHSLPHKILSCSQVARDLHIGLGYHASRMVIIPNGFDLTGFRPDAAARLKIRQELEIASEAFLVGHVGRFDPQKDYPNLIRAAAALIGKKPEVHFVLCGDGVHWQNKELAAWIVEQGLQPVFHLLGRREDIPQLMASFDLLTTSSAYGEAFPLVVGEAMACGVPCVVTDVGDSAYLVAETGKVVPPRDPASLAEAWLALLSLPAQERAALGKAARQRIQDHFSLPAVAAQYAALYRELAAEGAR